MKRIRLIIFLIFSVSVASGSFAAITDNSSTFRYYMHEIFKNYKNTQLSINMGNYDAAEIHLTYIQEYLQEISKISPDRNKDGTELDKKAFFRRILDFQGTVKNLKEAVVKRDAKSSKQLSRDIFQICVDCHTEVKLEFLFRLPGDSPLFTEYMHGVIDNYNLAALYLENEMPNEAEAHLKLMDHYIQLLKVSFPYRGKNGAVADKELLMDKILLVERWNEMAQNDLHGKKTADLGNLREVLNKICATCH